MDKEESHPSTSLGVTLSSSKGQYRIIASGAGWLDRRPQLELLDFDALARWAGFQRQEERWGRQLVACLREAWDRTSGDAKRELLDYLVRNPMPALATLPAADAIGCLAALQSICASGASMPLSRTSWCRSSWSSSRSESPSTT